MVVHVALLLVLALWVQQTGLPMAGIELVASHGEANSSQLEDLSTFELAPQPELAQTTEAEAVQEDVELAYELDPLFGPPASDNGPNAALLNLSAGDAASTLRTGSSDGGASFFGSYAQGNRFVYVLDSSRSMRGDRWTYACNELVDSLNKLKPEQEFFIICFDLRTTYLFNKKPGLVEYESPTDVTIAQVRRWLRGRTLGRATMPADALRAALEFAPDAIFLLSDGELQDGTLMMLRTLNPRNSAHRQVPIHTVHLFSPFGHNTLETIALENGGTFTHVGN